MILDTFNLLEVRDFFVTMHTSARLQLMWILYIGKVLPYRRYGPSLAFITVAIAVGLVDVIAGIGTDGTSTRTDRRIMMMMITWMTTIRILMIPPTPGTITMTLTINIIIIIIPVISIHWCGDGCVVVPNNSIDTKVHGHNNKRNYPNLLGTFLSPY